MYLILAKNSKKSCFAAHPLRVLQVALWYKTTQYKHSRRDDLAKSMSNRVILYTREDCHLCHQAMDLFKASGDDEWELVERDIDGDIRLLAMYGTRIPVLRREDTGAELAWPMTAGRVQRFLRTDT